MRLIDQFHKQTVVMNEWFAQPRVRFVALTLYYLGILAGLVALYGPGDFSTPPFIYQNF